MKNFHRSLNAALIAAACTLAMGTSEQADANTAPCDHLRQELAEAGVDHPAQPQYFSCSQNIANHAGDPIEPSQSCMVTYLSQDENGITKRRGAFLDIANDGKAHWMHQIRSNWLMGDELSGYYVCADVKTYVQAQDLGGSFDVRLTKSSLRESQFCPFWKLFFAYSVRCTPEL